MSTAQAAGLVVGYGETEVAGPLDLRLRPGITALLGRNGSGKTTLMRTLCGIIPALRGTCRVLDVEVEDGAAVRSRVGYLGHESALATSLTVEQNLEFWQSVTGTYPEVTRVGLPELIERFDLSELVSRKVATLSRGQRQRVDLARLAMTDPEFVVLDEPLSGLDPVYAAQTRDLLRDWGRERTVLYSTHSVPEAIELADAYLIVTGHEVVELGGDGTAVTETDILEILGRTS
ncbi:ABC transporter ATP-binding protein [Aeromicrobium sp. YIM 150415]|uniref:ABC transporter ATP-binding protein n=1 Tax=Aeromicrobium sp. YIM 150415 TaxID=2803912 RepID=UPI001965DADE|nr:ABC transporter ATP-binding protein [Aeromicrobium sp. YIM 150415]MBM9463795.1 ABC transporter ATP-binding protein [Aeromicrobium sp. YIM 150415]